jgi:hypothetical protein
MKWGVSVSHAIKIKCRNRPRFFSNETALVSVVSAADVIDDVEEDKMRSHKLMEYIP